MRHNWECVLGFLLVQAGFLGCAPTVVSDADGIKPLSTIAITCKRPHRLSQDCSIWTGATRKIRIDGHEVKVAASEDGMTILVMDAHLTKDALKDFVTFHYYTSTDCRTKGSNSSFEAVKSLLLAHGVTIQKVTPLVTMGDVDGYFLDVNADGYSLLKPYTVD